MSMFIPRRTLLVQGSESESESLSHIQLFVIPWTVAQQGLLFIEFFGQKAVSLKAPYFCTCFCGLK